MHSVHPVSHLSTRVLSAATSDLLTEWREQRSSLTARTFECVFALLVSVAALAAILEGKNLTALWVYSLQAISLAGGVVALITAILSFLHLLRAGVLEVRLHEHRIDPH